MNGVKETNGIKDFLPEGKGMSEWLKEEMSDITVDWTDSRLARITRLRLVSDPGYPVWDVSYCFGQLKDGTNVHVSLPFSDLPKRRINASIIYYAKKDGVFAKGLGIFNAISTLI